MGKYEKHQKIKKQYDVYDLINFHVFINENHKDMRDIGNGLLMWEKYINEWENKEL